MKLDLSLRVMVFLVAGLVIMLGQAVYSYYNLQAFQSSYIQALQDKTRSAGLFLRDDIERILALGIPLQNIARLEHALAQSLNDLPEVAFIEIVGPAQDILFVADPTQARHVERGTEVSRLLSSEHAFELAELGLAPTDTDITIPLRQNGEVQGFLHIHLSGQIIHAESRQILWDMLTVMLTSLLLTFEFLAFFVVYYISHPLKRLRNHIAMNMTQFQPVRTEDYSALGRIGVLADTYNRIIEPSSIAFCTALGYQQTISQVRPSLDSTLQQQIQRIAACKQRLQAVDGPASLTAQIHTGVELFKGRLNRLHRQLADTHRPLQPSAPLHGQESLSATPTALIRPLIFLFIMADGLSLSFFPLYVDSLYEPVLGLSRELVISLPLSAFMLIMAISLPLSGVMTDSFGWRRPLLIGLVLNAAGHVLTAMAQDITQLIAFRALVAVGFGMVFICCQRFIIDNTDQRSRAMGMAGFLAAFFSGDICGTVIGAMLAERIGYADVFYISAVFTVLTLIFTVLVFRGDFKPQEDQVSANAPARFKIAQMFTVFRDREFSALVVLQAIPAKLVLVGFLFFFTPLYLNSIDALQSNIGRIIMCYSVCLIFIGPGVSYLFPQAWLRRYLVMAGGLITAAALLSFWFFEGIIPVLIMVILLGIAHSFSVSSQASLVTETPIVSQMGSGAGMGVFRFWERLGNVIGPVVMAVLIGQLGYQYSVVALGVLTLVCTVLYWVLTTE